MRWLHRPSVAIWFAIAWVGNGGCAAAPPPTDAELQAADAPETDTGECPDVDDEPEPLKPGYPSLHLDMFGLKESVLPRATDLRITVERIEALIEPELPDGSGRLGAKQLVLVDDARWRRRLSLTGHSRSPERLFPTPILPGRLYQVRVVVSALEITNGRTWEPIALAPRGTTTFDFDVVGAQPWLDTFPDQWTTAVAPLNLGPRGHLKHTKKGLQRRPSFPTVRGDDEILGRIALGTLMVHYAPETTPAQRAALLQEFDSRSNGQGGDVDFWYVPTCDVPSLLAFRDTLARRPEFISVGLDPIWSFGGSNVEALPK